MNEVQMTVGATMSELKAVDLKELQAVEGGEIFLAITAVVLIAGAGYAGFQVGMWWGSKK